jgi:hypothetical protein
MNLERDDFWRKCFLKPDDFFLEEVLAIFVKASDFLRPDKVLEDLQCGLGRLSFSSPFLARSIPGGKQ